MTRFGSSLPRYTFFLVCLTGNLIIAWILHGSAIVLTKFEANIGMVMSSHAPYRLNVSTTSQPEGKNATTASMEIPQNKRDRKIVPRQSQPSTENPLPQQPLKAPTPTVSVQPERANVRKRNAPDQMRSRNQRPQHSATSSFSSLNARLREKYNAKNAPILESYSPDTSDPIRVRILLFEYKNKTLNFRKGPTSAISDELLNICLDGFERSAYFEPLPSIIIPDDPQFHLAEEEGKDVVWVIDMRRTFRLHQVVSLVKRTLSFSDNNNNNNITVTHPPKLKLVFIDYTDKYFMTLCQNDMLQLFDILGKENVRQVKQQIVQARDWEENIGFPRPGIISDPKTMNHCFEDHPAVHTPYTVRSDYAEAVLHEYHLPSSSSKNGDQKIVVPNNPTSHHFLPSHTTRPTDVAHFWSVREKDSSAHLRNAVTETLLALVVGNNMTTVRDRPLQVIANTVSTAEGTGRTSVQSAYTQALLTTKIVVVAQRDGYEDHYRLFEAIVGGALVMTDPMLTLPEEYVDGKNIVLYHSLEELTKLVLYYLEHDEERVAIATKGWELAMARHRTFHWMERVFFGRPLTNVTDLPTLTES
jgi:hypothetical protein